MSTRMMGLLTGGLALALALPLVAQTPPADQPAGPPELPIGAERALGMRARLGLSAQQIDRLEAVRKTQLESRRARMSEMLDLRSRLEAGDISRDRFQAELQSRREAMGARTPAAGSRVRDILTDGQREKFRTLQREAMRERRFAGRGGSFRRGGGRGAAAFGRSGFGRRGFGPGRAPAFGRAPGNRGMGPGLRPGGRPGVSGAPGQMWRRGPDAGPVAPRFSRGRPRPDSTAVRPPEDGR
jgi:LTXXQ motif family protein